MESISPNRLFQATPDERPYAMRPQVALGRPAFGSNDVMRYYAQGTQSQLAPVL
jgi:hypothetical protein